MNHSTRTAVNLTVNLTERILEELSEGPGTAFEVACSMGLDGKLVAGMFGHLRRKGVIEPWGVIREPEKGNEAVVYKIKGQTHGQA